MINTVYTVADKPKYMTDFKNIKHFNCSLDFNFTHLLTIGVMLFSNAFFGGGVFFFHWLFDDLDVESASKYVARKHRILTTMNISGNRVIHIVIVLCLPLPSVWHLSFITKSSQNWKQDLFQKWKLYRRTRTPIWLLSVSRVIRILMRVIRLTNWKPCRCYYTCGYIIFMAWVISPNNLTATW